MSRKREKGKMKLFYFLKNKSKQFLCHMVDKEIVDGKIDFLVLFFLYCIVTTSRRSLIPSILLYLKRVYTQVHDIESG